MERIDKIIASQTTFSRKDVKKLILQKRIKVNDKIISKTDEKVDLKLDIIKLDDKIISVTKYVYLVLNKPKGYISATEDRLQKTVLDLVPEEYRHRDLFPVGRLDKDTTGLMIISDDGEFSHRILSPKKHVKKVYEVMIDIPLKENMVKEFEDGVELNDGICKKALLEIVDEYNAKVTLTEGRYHQIKRMFGCFGAKVVELNRICIGNFFMPEELSLGECRELTNEELNLIEKRD